MTEAWRDARGTWRCRGYGRLLEVDTDAVRLFDTTSESCLQIERWSLSEASDAYDRLVVRGNELSVYERGGITRYDHDRIEAFVTTEVPRDRTDPTWNFDVFWRAFDEQYGFFDVRGVDWNAIRDDLRPRVLGAGSDALAEVLGEAIRTLADAHVELDLGDRTITSDDRGDRTLSAWWRREAASDQVPSGSFARAMRNLVHDGLGVRGAQLLANDRLVVGEIDATTGYIAILSMWGYAPEGASQSEDAQAAAGAIDRALAELSGKRALVVDVRTNGGGWDAVSLAIAARFADRPRVAFTKRARLGDGHTEPQAITVEPAGGSPFLGPVALLTSGSTGSAAEIFIFCMAVLPNVTTVGQPTRGITSDELAKHLPNGWIVTLSNERYETPNGICYEGVGIPPEVPVAPRQSESLSGYMRRGVEVAARAMS